jgi:hypothetical protein
MAQSPAAPLTEEAFLADRMSFWHSFNTVTVIGVVSMAVLLAAMWLFLV